MALSTREEPASSDEESSGDCRSHEYADEAGHICRLPITYERDQRTEAEKHEHRNCRRAKVEFFPMHSGRDARI